MPLNIIYQGSETAIDDDATALIGSDAASTIRIVRPGISRKHAVASFDGAEWKVEDAGSRNGIFADGQRIQTTVISRPTTLYLGHPTSGEAISFVPLQGAGTSAENSIQDEIDAFVMTKEPESDRGRTTRTAVEASAAIERTRKQSGNTATATASDVELAALTTALRDQISSIKGLTWSVWAMIAVTAVLAVMTLFVGVLGS